MEKLIFLGVILCSVTIVYFIVQLIIAIMNLIKAITATIKAHQILKMMKDQTEVLRNDIFNGSEKDENKGVLISLKPIQKKKK